MHIATSQGRSARPTVYFLTPDYQKPAGGTWVIYRHVDILNRSGISAFALHQKAGFRFNWFENDTAVTSVTQAAVQRGDLLVVSELHAHLLARLPKGIRHAIFNQNSHLTWLQNGGDVHQWYVPSPDLAGILAVSEHNRQMLRYAFPHARIERIHLSIDCETFCPATELPPRRIAYMPRRGSDDARQVLEMLRARGALNGWDVVPLDGISHDRVADELRRSRIFLAFTRQEGFGLPAAEAMACGCYVVGNHGFGGAEFFSAEYSTAVETGNVLGFARATEDVLREENKSAGWCFERGKIASRAILNTYSKEREQEEVVRIYSEFLQMPAGAAA